MAANVADQQTISLGEAAHRLGVSPKAIRRAIERGDLPGFAWGRTYRIPKLRFEQVVQLLPDLEFSDGAAK
jgi:excisionase family DNA binding protein